MKNLVVLSLTFFFSFGIVQAQAFKGLDKSPLDMIEYPSSNKQVSKLARVLYSRPQLKGRNFNSLVSEGKIWRMGANESTELTLYVPMKLGDTMIEAGSYTLYAIPNGKQMTLIVNRAIHVWGAYSYKEEMDVVRVSIPIIESKDSIEAFSMAFEGVDDGVHLHMAWGNSRFNVKFTKA